MTSKKIANPFAASESYHCFGCSPRNPIGLKLEFREENEWLLTEWTPDKNYEGWANVLHGGVQATLLDEIGSWIVFVKLHTAGVTSRMEMKFHQPVYISDGMVAIRARIVEMKRNIAVIEAFLYNNSDVVCASALMHYYTFTTEKAREQFMFPGSDAFYQHE